MDLMLGRLEACKQTDIIIDDDNLKQYLDFNGEKSSIEALY